VYAESENNRMRLKRANMPEEEKAEENLKARERMQLLRKRRKESEADNFIPQAVSQAYSTSQSLGKAVSKAFACLPADCSKRIAVLQELCKREHMTVINRIQPQFFGMHSRDASYKVVEEFYLRDDISRQAPGLKDTCYVKEAKQKVICKIIYFIVLYKQ